MKSSLIALCSSIALLVPAQALAHFGHLEELAGHGHFLDWGVLVAAATMTVALARRGRSEKQIDRNEPESAEEAETA